MQHPSQFLNGWISVKTDALNIDISVFSLVYKCRSGREDYNLEDLCNRNLLNTECVWGVCVCRGGMVMVVTIIRILKDSPK